LVSGVVDGDESRGLNNGCLESLHGIFVLFLPLENSILAREVNEGVSNREIVLDPNSHVAGDTKKGMDVGESFAGWPVVDLCDLGVVWDATVVVAFVA
jgi:hypothetical protein